jgi:hypothetical protein
MNVADTKPLPTRKQQDNFNKRLEEIIEDNKDLCGNYAVFFTTEGTAAKFSIIVNTPGKTFVDLLSSTEFSQFVALQSIWNNLFS